VTPAERAVIDAALKHADEETERSISVLAAAISTLADERREQQRQRAARMERVTQEVIFEAIALVHTIEQRKDGSALSFVALQNAVHALIKVREEFRS
jgi:hypothetical protein